MPSVQELQQAALARMQQMCSQRPIGVKVESTTLCNSRCVFCAYRKIKRENMTLSMGLFEKLCDEFSKLQGGFMGFSGVVSDPLLDPLLLDRLRLVRDKYPAVIPHMFTNAIRMPHFSDEQVVFMLESMEHIDISIGGLNAADYKLMFGVDKFEDVWKSLERLARLKEQTGNYCRLALHIRTNKPGEIRTSPKLKELLDMGYQCGDVLHSFADWGGIVTQDDLPPGAILGKPDYSNVAVPCLMAIIYFIMLPDGRVTACACMDAKEQLIIGDLTKQSMLEIWNGPKRRAFIESFAPGKVADICKTCQYYSGYTQVLSNPKFLNFLPWEDIWA